MLLAGRPCAKKVRAKSHCMAKHSLKEFEDLLVWSFLKMATCFFCFASRCSSLSSSLWTSRGGSCIFAASLYSLPFSRQSLRSFFLTLVTIAELPLSPESKTSYVCWQHSIVPVYLGINFCSRMLKHLENELKITIWHLMLLNPNPWLFSRKRHHPVHTFH